MDRLKLQELIECKTFQLKGLGLANVKLEEEIRLAQETISNKEVAMRSIGQELQKYRDMTRYR